MRPLAVHGRADAGTRAGGISAVARRHGAAALPIREQCAGCLGRRKGAARRCAMGLRPTRPPTFASRDSAGCGAQPEERKAVRRPRVSGPWASLEPVAHAIRVPRDLQGLWTVNEPSTGVTPKRHGRTEAATVSGIGSWITPRVHGAALLRQANTAVGPGQEHRGVRPTRSRFQTCPRPTAPHTGRPTHSHRSPAQAGEQESRVMFEPRASDLDLVDVENALLRGAFGDYADEAAILLLINFGHWLPQLQSADLITSLRRSTVKDGGPRSPGPTSSRPSPPG